MLAAKVKAVEERAHERAHPKPGKQRVEANAAVVEAAPAAHPPHPIAPDCAGQDFYAIDAGLQQLLALYLPADTRAHLEPHFKRLGVLAGGRLDELARIADKNGPVLHARDRFGRDEDWIEYHPATARWRRSPSATSSSTP